MDVRLMRLADLDQVSTLFDAYRVFYKQSTDLARAKDFITERFQEGTTRIFVCEDQEEILGFTQLFPSFTSTGMEKIWILNDLFVDEKHRRKKVAHQLINHCIKYAQQTQRTKVILETGIDNIKAQALYDKMSFSKCRSINYEFSI